MSAEYDYGYSYRSDYYYHRDEYIASQMDEKRKEAEEKLAKIVRAEHAQLFSRILSSSWWNDEPEAKKIATLLSLNESHFLSIDDRKEEFKEQYLEDCADSQADAEADYDIY